MFGWAHLELIVLSKNFFEQDHCFVRPLPSMGSVKYLSYYRYVQISEWGALKFHSIPLCEARVDENTQFVIISSLKILVQV